MLERTRKLWDKQRGSVGDRSGLFSAVAAFIDAQTVLYAGSYVDLTPSLIWPSVTYVDVDRRANQFFGDVEGVRELLGEMGVEGEPTVRFIHADYSSDLDIDDESVDLLISLYAGFISPPCTRFLRVGGHLFVNPSHGDADMAHLDRRYRLRGVVEEQDGVYVVRTDEIDAYFQPKKDIEVTVELLEETGRAVAHTRSAFAYVFERIS